MKNTSTIGLLLVITFLFILDIQLYKGNVALEQQLNKIQTPTFIWNDDQESIPTDNSLITLELTEGDTIYIGPYNSKAKIE